MITDESDGVRLFDKPPTEQPLVSDIAFWRGILSELKTAETEYSEKLSEVVRMIDARCKRFFLGELSREQADFNRFMNDVHFFRNQINHKSQRASNDGDQFGQDCIALDNFRDDPIQNLDVDLHGRCYRDTRKTFLKTQRLLDKKTINYQTLSLEQEKLELEMLRCRNEKKYVEMDSKFVDLEKKIKKAENSYKKMLERFQDERELLIPTADQYAFSWKDREAIRGQYVTKVLYQSNNRRDRANQHKREPRFQHFDVLAIMEDIGETIFIEDQQFQKYNKSCSRQMKRDLFEKIQRANKDITDKKDDDILEQVMYANTTFKKLYQWQLSLKKGEKIRQILPPNDSGFAFGEVTDSHGKKSRGFYPAQCVEQKRVGVVNVDGPLATNPKPPRKQKSLSAKGSVKKSTKRTKASSKATNVFAKNPDEPGTLANPFAMSKEEWIEEKKKAAEALMKGLMS